MEKINNFLLQNIAFFIIAVLVFLLFKRLGLVDSVWMYAIGSTVGHIMFEGYKAIKKKRAVSKKVL
jgi:hypothetical protein